MRNILIIIALLNMSLQAFGFERDWNAVQTWVYQLENYTNDRLNEIAQSKFDLVVIDLSSDGGKDYFTHEEIDAVKKSGKIILAYFEIGAIENYRPEWNKIPADLKAGKIDKWPEEQYVKFWDERWWPIVKGRVDQAIRAGFDGAYLDMVTAYEEIQNSGLGTEERAHKMVDLIVRISTYTKDRNTNFKIVPQNCPELYTWSYWGKKPNQKYLNAIDGLALESVFYMAHDIPADKDWCMENRANAIAVRKAGKLVLGVDYAIQQKSIADAYRKQKELGFVPFVSLEALDRIPQKVE